jgi:hypothetical protein
MAILRIRLTFKEGYSDLAKSSSHVEYMVFIFYKY